MSKIILALLLVFTFFFVGCGEKDNVAPEVVSTFPPNGSQNVDPSVKEIWVVFNEPMRDQNWSWAYTKKEEFPQMDGQPYYTDDYTKNVLPVTLEPNKEYVIWLNSAKFKNFKDKSGNPLVPVRFTFKTK